MKLLFCPFCYDVIRLIEREWRQCDCEKSGGQYNKDGMTATLGGAARVFGVANPFFDNLWLELDEIQRIKYREKNHYGPGDCWWGEFKGDTQIFRIESAEGPRLRIKVKQVSAQSNEVTIIDSRKHWIDGIFDADNVIVPANVEPSFKGKRIPKWLRVLRKRDEQIRRCEPGYVSLEESARRLEKMGFLKRDKQ